MIGEPTVVEHASSTVADSSSRLTRMPLQTSPPSTPTAESGTAGVHMRMRRAFGCKEARGDEALDQARVVVIRVETRAIVEKIFNW